MAGPEATKARRTGGQYSALNTHRCHFEIACANAILYTDKQKVHNHSKRIFNGQTNSIPQLKDALPSSSRFSTRPLLIAWDESA